MKRVAIAGVGLIGGSFGLALREAGFDGEIAGISSDATLKAARERGAIDLGITLEEAAATADLIYLAQPIDQIVQTLESLGPRAHPDCLITDAGSTKSRIDEQARWCISQASFQGGHPMAGKEQRGVQHADPHLFRDRPYVLTPATRPSGQATEFREWLVRMGARVAEMTPAEHDRTVALTSHLPQLISTTLAAALERVASADTGENLVEKIFGPGLLDMTRLALSTPDLWSSILRTNTGPVLEALSLFNQELSRAIADLAAGDVDQLFEEAAGFARKIRPTH